MKAIIRVEIEIDDNYVEERNNIWKHNYKCFGRKYKSAEEALKKYPLERGIADIIEDCLKHKQEGLVSCSAYVDRSNSI